MEIQKSNVDYYSKIPDSRDANLLPKDSSADTSVGYEYTGMTEEMRIGRKVMDEHYQREYKENLRQSDPYAYVHAKYFDKTSPHYRSGMTAEQRRFASITERRMLSTGGKTMAGYASFDYSLRDYEGIYTGGKNKEYIRNTNKEKQYSRSVINQQICTLLAEHGIEITKQTDLKFQIDPYTYKLTVSGNADKDKLLTMEKILNMGDNAKNIWAHAWTCMHDSDNEIVNSQGSQTKAAQSSLWHEFYQTTGYDIRNVVYQDGTFVTEDGTDLLKLYKQKASNIAGMELYTERLLKFVRNGWNTANDLNITIGFNSNGLYDMGQENGYGTNQTLWIKGQTQSMFDAKI